MREVLFSPGDTIVVAKTFISDGIHWLKKDTTGKVQQIDSDGDAQVKFEGHSKLLWVKAPDFCKLSKACGSRFQVFCLQ